MTTKIWAFALCLGLSVAFRASAEDCSEFLIARNRVVSQLAARATVRIDVMTGNGHTANCSGAYIGNGKIVTAAHCFEYAGESPFGWIFIGDNKLSCGIKKVKFAKVSRRPRGSDSSSLFWPDDVAVVTLDTNNSEDAEDFVRQLEETEPFRVSKSLQDPEYFAGFGSRSYLSTDPSTKLSGLNLSEFKKVTTRTEIRKIMSEFAEKSEKDIDDLYESISSGRKTCYFTRKNGLQTAYFADSGGPAYTLKNGKPYLAGIFSVMLINDRGRTMPENRVMAFCITNLHYLADWILGK